MPLKGHTIPTEVLVKLLNIIGKLNLEPFLPGGANFSDFAKMESMMNTRIDMKNVGYRIVGVFGVDAIAIVGG